MKEISMYVANDGKMFEDENECRAYEIKSKLGHLKKDVAIYDDNGHEIKIHDFCGDALELNAMLNDAYFIKVNTEEALHALVVLLYECDLYVGGLEWNGNPDIFIYGDLFPGCYAGEWNSWNERVEVMRSFKTNYIDKMRGE